jgi:hypothetical protein
MNQQKFQRLVGLMMDILSLLDTEKLTTDKSDSGTLKTPLKSKIINNIRVQTVSIDTQSGPIQPFYDADTGLIFVPGRGEGNIRYYEYNSGSVKPVSEYKSGTSQKSVCFFPKRYFYSNVVL